MATMEYKWVLARYPIKSSQGKVVIAHADAGIGYHIIEKDDSPSGDVIVAFKRAEDGSNLPIQLVYANDKQITRLDELDKRRMGLGK